MHSLGEIRDTWTRGDRHASIKSRERAWFHCHPLSLSHSDLPRSLYIRGGTFSGLGRKALEVDREYAPCVSTLHAIQKYILRYFYELQQRNKVVIIPPPKKSLKPKILISNMSITFKYMYHSTSNYQQNNSYI